MPHTAPQHVTEVPPDVPAIVVRGASEHNLQHVDLVIPKHRLVVFTGVSGSGKSSLAFDTLYAEGQRRYVESLSAYARQFLGQMDKPRYDSIRGLSPTISIEQRSASTNPRSTVGTVTEIHDYLRLLYARAGTMYCPTCGRPTEASDAAQMVRSIGSLPVGSRLLVLAPIARDRKGTFADELAGLRLKGFTRVRVDGAVVQLEDLAPLDKNRRHSLDVVVDRLVVREDGTPRLTDSVETALRLGEGRLVVQVVDGDERLYSESRHCPYCDLGLPEPTPALFSFNSPQGACRACNGLGTTHEVDLARVIPDHTLSIRDGAVAPWEGSHPQHVRSVVAIRDALARRYGIDLDRAFVELPDDHRQRVLFGTDGEAIEVAFDSGGRTKSVPMPFEGVVGTLQRRYRESQSGSAIDQYRRYFVEVPCAACGGTRLRAEAAAVRVAGVSLPELTRRPVGDLNAHFRDLQLEGNAAVIAAEIVRELRARLGFLVNVGLDYLTLDRPASTLSGGESQRIRLASQVGSELTGVLYILDEPSIGLHPRDNRRLIETLCRLRDVGNTVIVVEHDMETIREADWVVDFGPGAGRLGGHVVAAGPPAAVAAVEASCTGQYLCGARRIEVPTTRRPLGDRQLVVRGARANNLADIDVAFPVGAFTVVTGVSGAGKSTLVNHILHPAAARVLHGATGTPGEHDRIEGLEHFSKVVAIDQKPIGRTPRSNPATYTKAFDAIRQVFASTREARVYGFDAGRFSFNVKGGRCEVCQGAGVNKIEMHFLPDVYVRCESCRGRRFNDATLRVHYKGFTIFDVLEMPVDQACEVFGTHRTLKRILGTLQEVGLGYVALGQPATTLSGGEAQRVKLSRELARVGQGDTLYILDEPSTGLHFEDVRKLLAVVHRLVDAGNTIVMIEHNLDIIKTADHVIDIGPEGGGRGGRLIAEGTPEAVARSGAGYTARFLAAALPAVLPAAD